MQTTVYITGQISGNITLHNAICNGYSVTNKGMFYSYYLTFPTRQAAYSALWEGYKLLRNDREDARNSMLSYSAKSSIRYDASIAKIVTE